MIITEKITINGTQFIRTYSDKEVMIERDGVRYGEAIDPIGFDRAYTETNEPIDGGDEATDSDYAEAGKILLGVSE
jgi:hypothetical protein